AELHADLAKLGRGGTLDSTVSRNNSLEFPAQPSLAVLPFENLSGKPEEDYLATGLWTD
ncbi:MAG: hypothetical protein GTO30_21860, partial [Acidobacteria bacterium]|nr:hypothetical protein [Acidobacteriota bacterium]NIQ87531.1 hypothetical protein [Acidobacteriota bacterium]